MISERGKPSGIDASDLLYSESAKIPVSSTNSDKQKSWSMKFGIYSKKTIEDTQSSYFNGDLNNPMEPNNRPGSFNTSSNLNTSNSNGNYSFWPNSFEDIQKGGSAVFNRLASRIEEGIQDLQSQIRPDFPKLPDSLKGKIPLGFSFSVSAMLIPYHLGVILELQEQGYITESTPLSGASGGSIAAICCALDISMYEAMEACISLYEDCRKHGTAGRLNQVLERELRKKLPDNVIELLNNRSEKGGQIIISFTQLLPVPKAHFVSDFNSKDDLIECILASSTIPFLSVPWPTFKCRGKPCVDGYFAVGRGELGCLPTNAIRTVKVCPLPSAGSSMKSNRSDVISPHIQSYDWILFSPDSHNNSADIAKTRKWIRSLRPAGMNLESLKSNLVGNKNIEESEINTTKEYLENCELREVFNSCYVNNNPNYNAPPLMKYSNNELLRIAVDPPSSQVAWELFYIGRGDALRWIMIDRIRESSYKLMEPTYN
ncbi:patatin like esterase [Cryptosporidium sp. chipmunk genotype I]|uniref:patatin like esterase n=1 Tax=Cryptosporidium sp. chipmunk genotype I TaxID=1280935 RepID=UPI00351A5FBA|nr:patatin like esterase [Cryptosporidium sp. chipmunk genotype I]